MMRYFNLHTHHFTGEKNVVEFVNQYPQEFDGHAGCFSIGIHPWRIVESRVSEDLQIIQSKLPLSNCVALGECGLDKRIDASFELQAEVFKKQLAIAEAFKKPVIIHCVAAYQEAIAIKKEMKITVPMVIHGFSKNEQTAKQLLDNGFYLSFGKYLLRNPALKSVFQNVPNERFFLETDMIDETIFDVYALAAKYKNVSLTELQQLVAANIEKVFGILKDQEA